MPEAKSNKEVALFPNQQVFIQSLTTGITEVHVGPLKVNPGAQDQPVIFNSASGEFTSVADTEKAIQKHPFAPEGFYVELLNPSYRLIKGRQGTGQNDKPEPDREELIWPQSGKKESEQTLRLGRKINIPGPITFPLWPGQMAQVIRAHQPRSNQFLLVKVYNAEQAKAHWGEAQIKTSVISDIKTIGEDIAEGQAGATALSVALASEAPANLRDGDQFIIKGTEISFYIPPTGIQVIPEIKGETKPESYLRSALTLERMEYCILLGEDGNKRFEIGPQVVFPLSTEEFISRELTDGTEVRKFQATELTIVQGLHIMVTADYTDDKGQKHKAGDELFLRGTDTPIYVPRPEHRLVGYDKRGTDKKHYATAIPEGHGKYVLERQNAKIRIVRGPNMYLPDPRVEVYVRRALTKTQSELWYPGNEEAKNLNTKLREMAAKTPSTRSGSVSEGEIGIATVGAAGAGSANYMSSMGLESHTKGGIGKSTRSMRSAEMTMERSFSNASDSLAGAEESTRSNNYNEGRSIILDPKFSGVPMIAPYLDFAVQVRNISTGKTRVEVGPTTILMEYAEELTVLRLSMGKPKTTDNLLSTVYLQHKSNKISDILDVSTKDHVAVKLKYSLNVDFEDGSREKWFNVQNYVKHLCDHVRSVLKAVIKKMEIAEFYAHSTDVIRDALLGKVEAKEGAAKRPNLMFFPENGMRVMDVDVLDTEIQDPGISKLLKESAVQTVRQNIDLSNQRADLEAFKEKQEIERSRIQENIVTIEARSGATITEEVANQEVELARKKNSEARAAADLIVVKLTEEIESHKFNLRLSRAKDEGVQRAELASLDQNRLMLLESLRSELQIAQIKEMNGGFGAVVAALHDKGTLEMVAKAMGPLSIIGGESLVDVVKRLIGEPLAKLLQATMDSNGLTQLPSKPGSAAPATKA